MIETDGPKWAPAKETAEMMSVLAATNTQIAKTILIMSSRASYQPTSEEMDSFKRIVSLLEEQSARMDALLSRMVTP